jgi:UDP-N-acetylmuramoylalanine--D-glutamate ligase
MKESLNIVVLGGGESGVGAGILAKKNGAKVLVSDYSSISDLHQKKS